MSDSPLPDFIIVGPQKCATTWLYECLYEHPDVLMPETDSVHYFDMNYHRDLDWYRDFFSNYDGEAVVGEETPSYIREQQAPQRIHEQLPDVKLIFCLRNPVDRAYSHYWHEKGKNKIEFEFSEVFENYDLFQNWVVPGFYHRHLTRYEQYFDPENMKILFLDDLIEDDEAYIRSVYDFIGVDDSFKPSLLNEKTNEAKYKGPKWLRKAQIGFREGAPDPIVDALRPVHHRLRTLYMDKSEYDKGMNDETRHRLIDIFESDIRKLSEHTGRDLDHWIEP